MEQQNEVQSVLYVNSVVQRQADDHVFRILLVDFENNSYWIDISSGSNIPSTFNPDEVRQGLQNGSYIHVVDKWASTVLDSQLSEKSKEHQQRAWDLIGEIVLKSPAIYDRKERSVLLREVELKTGVKRTNLYLYLGRYWRGGMTADALYPEYGNCGKSTYIENPNANMPGRKKRPNATGKRLTQKDISIFQTGITEFYLVDTKPSLRSAYDATTKKYYATKFDDDGKRIPLLPDEVPSFFQFKNWYYANRDPVSSVKNRMGEKDFDLKHRAILNKAISYVFGPCDAIQIDATIGDDYVVRRDNRSAIAGRPTVYFVIDVVGSMVVGLHVSLDPPSWDGALMAIMNCLEDKVAFCARYGITIKPEDWPCRFIPNRIIADRGEVESRAADILVKELGISIDNTVPYRGDFKGIVEQHFHVTNVELPSDRPGHIQPNFRQRGAHDYRLDAVLDTFQYTAMIIHQTLFYNNHHWMKSFIRTPDMRAHNVPSVPRDVWNHGLKYSTGLPRTLPSEKIRFAALPKAQAKIDREGIHLNELTYTCDLAEDEGWFAKADIVGTQYITAAYNPTDAAFIYVLAGKNYVECHLVKYHETYCGMHLSEVNAAVEDDKDMEAAHRIHELNAEHLMTDAIEKIIAKAKSMAPDVSDMTKAERLKGIQQNRHEERKANIDTNTRTSLEMAGLLPKGSDQEKLSGNVTDTEEENSKLSQPIKENPSASKSQSENGLPMTPMEEVILSVLEEALAEEEAENE